MYKFVEKAKAKLGTNEIRYDGKKRILGIQKRYKDIMIILI